jgi:hypothetical protein
VLKYDANPGESIAVVGKNQELGQMIDFKQCPLKLKHDSNNIWQSNGIELKKGS